jgi:hypothetical protein
MPENAGVTEIFTMTISVSFIHTASNQQAKNKRYECADALSMYEGSGASPSKPTKPV